MHQFESGRRLFSAPGKGPFFFRPGLTQSGPSPLFMIYYPKGGIRMRLTVVFFTLLFSLSSFGVPVSAETPKFSRSQRESGTAVLRDLEIRDGRIFFRVDSGGCTDAKSFKVRIDACKAMLWDGVVIEMDLEKDLGFTGRYTVSVRNPVIPRGNFLP